LFIPLTIAVCTLFLAQTTSNILAENYLGDSPTRRPVPSLRPVSAAKKEPRSKSGAAFSTRNMFCHLCEKSPDALDPAVPDQRTRLPLRLIATNLAERDEHSFASVLNTSSHRQGGYRIGQEIPDAGIVSGIGHDYLAFHNASSDQIELVHFDTGSVRSTPASRAAGTRSKQTASSVAAEFVRAVDDTHFEVDRKLIETLQGDPKLAGARARPVAKNGKMQGVRLFAVRSSGLAHAMGLRNGDTLVAANGVKLQSMEAGLELLGQLKVKDHWSLDIQRRGKPITLQVDFE
jgi:general secretion pathway protein C